MRLIKALGIAALIIPATAMAQTSGSTGTAGGGSDDGAGAGGPEIAASGAMRLTILSPRQSFPPRRYRNSSFAEFCAPAFAEAQDKERQPAFTEGVFTPMLWRYLRTLRAAWRMRCSFSTMAMRTKPSPSSP